MALSREMRVMEDQVSRKCRRSPSLLLVSAEKLIIRADSWGGTNLLFSSSYETLYTYQRQRSRGGSKYDDVSGVGYKVDVI